MILQTAFPSMSKAKVDFSSLISKPDPDTKVKLEQLTELRKMVINYVSKNLDHADDLLINLDNYLGAFIKTVPLMIEKGAKKPPISWLTSLLSSKKDMNTVENKVGDFNLEVIMCYYLKATIKSALAESALNEFAKQLYPDVEQLKICYNHIVDAAKITNFISKTALDYLPKWSPDTRSGYPDLSQSIMTGLTKLFVAESEMIAVEKGLMEKKGSLSPLKIASIFKDIMNRLDEATNFFEDGLKFLSSSARSKFNKYYLTFCRGMKTFYEANFWFYYGTSFMDTERKFRLGCFEECKRKIAELQKNYIKALPKHQLYFTKSLSSKEDIIKAEIAENFKIYFESAAEVGAIPPVHPIPLIPSIEFIPANYISMVNAQAPSA